MLFNKPEKLTAGSILDWYGLCSEGIRQEMRDAHHSLTSGTSLPLHLAKIFKAGDTAKDIDNYFSSCLEELDLNALLIFVAATEARIRLDAFNRSKLAGSSISTRLSGHYANATKTWNVPLYDGGIVDEWKLFAATINTTILPLTDRNRILSDLGAYKELLDVRHWVAHGRYWQLKKSVKSYPPSMVAKKIQSIFDALNKLTIHAGITAFNKY